MLYGCMPFTSCVLLYPNLLSERIILIHTHVLTHIFLSVSLGPVHVKHDCFFPLFYNCSLSLVGHILFTSSLNESGGTTNSEQVLGRTNWSWLLAKKVKQLDE